MTLEEQVYDAVDAEPRSTQEIVEMLFAVPNSWDWKETESCLQLLKIKGFVRFLISKDGVGWVRLGANDGGLRHVIYEVLGNEKGKSIFEIRNEVRDRYPALDKSKIGWSCILDELHSMETAALVKHEQRAYHLVPIWYRA